MYVGFYCFVQVCTSFVLLKKQLRLDPSVSVCFHYNCKLTGFQGW